MFLSILEILLANLGLNLSVLTLDWISRFEHVVNFTKIPSLLPKLRQLHENFTNWTLPELRQFYQKSANFTKVPPTGPKFRQMCQNVSVMQLLALHYSTPLPTQDSINFSPELKPRRAELISDSIELTFRPNPKPNAQNSDNWIQIIRTKPPESKSWNAQPILTPKQTRNPYWLRKFHQLYQNSANFAKIPSTTPIYLQLSQKCARILILSTLPNFRQLCQNVGNCAETPSTLPKLYQLCQNSGRFVATQSTADSANRRNLVVIITVNDASSSARCSGALPGKPLTGDAHFSSNAAKDLKIICQHEPKL